MVEVFRTNVNSKIDAVTIIAHIHNMFASYTANFDLQDCDRILRIKCLHGRVKATRVIGLLNEFGYHAEVLTEFNPFSVLNEGMMENRR